MKQENPTDASVPPSTDATAPHQDASSTGDGAGDDGLRPGELVGGRYRVRGLLGRGGMGAVYDAEHEAIGRPVALKVMRPGVSDAARFLQEARIANQVKHRNVVDVTDFGYDRGRLYLVMERLEGETLASLVAREAPVDPAHAVDLVAPILDALAHLHARGVIHRDLKPENVMLASVAGEPEPVPRLLDFGIARTADDPRLTRTGATLGTPRYASPEQCRGDRAVDAASDQYAAAAMVYELLTGRAPHTAETLNLLLVAKITTPAPPIASLRADLSPALARAIDRALATDPAHRFPSVEALREALLASFAPRVATAAPPPAPAVARAVGVWPRALAAAALVAVAAAAAAWLARAPDAPPRVTPSPTPPPPPVRPAPAPREPAAPTLTSPPTRAPTPLSTATPPPTPPRHPPRAPAPRPRRTPGDALQMEIIREPPP